MVGGDNGLALMTTAAEPRPAELPLPGGRRAPPCGCIPCSPARCAGPTAGSLREEGRLAWRRAFGLGVKREDWLAVPVPAFLVEHPGVGLVLIDTGLHASVAVKPRQNMGRLSQFTFKDLEMDPSRRWRRSCVSATSRPATSRPW